MLDWLVERAADEPTLFGFDFSFAPPFIERGAYLPGEAGVPDEARAFWAYVDHQRRDEDLGAASFLEQVHRRHFYFGIADGVKADFVFFRQCDAALNAAGGRKTASAYDAIGAAQVAKASFSGMRLLHHLDGRVAVWPMDALPPSRQRGGRNLHPHLHSQRRPAGQEDPHRRRTRPCARSRSARRPPRLDHVPTDHQTDALVTAAGNARAPRQPRAFAPPASPPTSRAPRAGRSASPDDKAAAAACRFSSDGRAAVL